MVGEVDAAQRLQIAGRIRNAREVAGLTQQQVADRLHVTVRAYQEYEHGVRIPYKRMDELAAIVGVDKQSLLYGGGVAEPSGDALADLTRKVDLLLRFAAIQHAALLRGVWEGSVNEAELEAVLRRAEEAWQLAAVEVQDAADAG